MIVTERDLNSWHTQILATPSFLHELKPYQLDALLQYAKKRMNRTQSKGYRLLNSSLMHEMNPHMNYNEQKQLFLQISGYPAALSFFDIVLSFITARENEQCAQNQTACNLDTKIIGRLISLVENVEVCSKDLCTKYLLQYGYNIPTNAKSKHPLIRQVYNAFQAAINTKRSTVLQKVLEHEDKLITTHYTRLKQG